MIFFYYYLFIFFAKVREDPRDPGGGSAVSLPGVEGEEAG